MDARALFKQWLDRNREKATGAIKVFGDEGVFLDVIHQRLTGTMPGNVALQILEQPPSADNDKRILDYINHAIQTEKSRRPVPPAEAEDYEDDGAVPLPGEVRERTPHYVDPRVLSRRPAGEPPPEEEEEMVNEWAGGGELPLDDGPGHRLTRGARAPETSVSAFLDELYKADDRPLTSQGGLFLPIASQPIMVHTNGGRNRFVFRRKDIVAAFCVTKQPGEKPPTDEVEGSGMVLTGGVRLVSPGPELFDFVAEALEARKVLWPIVDDDEEEGEGTKK